MIAFLIATLCLILVPFAPSLIRLRISLLKWLHWTRPADLLERHFTFWVRVLRLILILIAAVFYLGWAQIPG